MKQVVLNLRGSEVTGIVLACSGSSQTSGMQAKGFGLGEEVECSGQKAGAGLALSCLVSRVSVSLVAALSLEVFARLPSRRCVLCGLNQLAAHTVRVWKDTCRCGT